MNSRNIPSTKDKDVQHQWTRIIAICAIVTIAVSLIIALFVYVFQFIPQEKRAEVRFSLVQTASMLDRAQDFVEKNPFTFEQDEAIDEAGELFRDGWTFYDDEQYDDALENFRNARLILYNAFPPGQVPSIYYYPLPSYPIEY